MSTRRTLRRPKTASISNFLDAADAEVRNFEETRRKAKEEAAVWNRMWTARSGLARMYYHPKINPAHPAVARLITDFLASVRSVGRGDRIDVLEEAEGAADTVAAQVYRLCDDGQVDNAVQLMTKLAERPAWPNIACRLMVTFPDRLAKEEGGDSEAPETTGQPADVDADAKAAKGKRIGERMAKMLLDNPTSIDWTVDDWKDKLRCSKSTVQGTTTWGQIMTMRKSREAETATKHKNYKPTDKRRMGTKRKRSAGV